MPSCRSSVCANHLATRQALRDGWLLTGDVGYRDADGYYFITDRKKDMLLVNGINVYLFGLGIKTFPYLMISSYILFLPAFGVREAMARLSIVNLSKHLSGSSKASRE